jgi:Flp pilus assembly pilin Flp
MYSLRKLFQDDDAVTAVEYAVMLALIIGVMIATLTATGHEASVLWNNINGELDAKW